MNHHVILLNGPSSSGKSTLAQALRNLILTEANEAYEVVSIDDFMKISKTETIYEDDVYEISGDMCSKVLELLEAGYGVIIDHVITSERIFEQLKTSLRSCSILMVNITCPLDILLNRESMRGDRCIGSAEASFKYLYPKEGYDLVVDTGTTAPEENAKLIYMELSR